MHERKHMPGSDSRARTHKPGHGKEKKKTQPNHNNNNPLAVTLLPSSWRREGLWERGGPGGF